MVAFGNRLVSAWQRARQRALVEAVVAGVFAGLAGLLVLALLRIAPADALGGLAPLREATWPLFVPAALAILVFAVSYLYRSTRLPSVLALAQEADSRFGFKETVSTVTELDQSGRTPDSAVLSALYRSAEADGARIDPQALVPIRLPRLALALPVLLVAAVAVLALTPAARLAEAERVASTETAPSATIADDEREQLAQDITRVAEVINKQLDVVGDPYMQAVARTLETLSERIASDPNLTRGELVEALDALAAHTEAATGYVPRSLRDQVADVLDTIARGVETPTTRVAEASATEGQEVPGESDLQGTPPQSQGDDEGGSGAPSELSAMLDAMEANQEFLGRGVDVDNETGDTADSVANANYYEIARQRNAEMEAQAAQMGENAQVIGAAADAQAGESQLAGQGTDELDLGGGELTGVEFESGDELLLAANPSGEGRRFEMDLPPEAEFSAVDRNVVLPEGTGWAYTPESTPERNGVGLLNRDAVSTYLQALVNRAPTDGEGAP